MRTKKIPYTEGSVMVVPLRKGGFARGVIARANPKHGILLGYFFGPRLESAETASLDGLRPANAILQLLFGDLGLTKGEWLILGQVPGWDREQWPMPDFVRKDPLGYLKPVLVRYADDDPNRIEFERVVDSDTGLLTDSVSGYGAVEIKLTKLLCDDN